MYEHEVILQPETLTLISFPILIHEVIENPSRSHNKTKKVEMTLTFSFFILRRLIGQISI